MTCIKLFHAKATAALYQGILISSLDMAQRLSVCLSRAPENSGRIQYLVVDEDKDLVPDKNDEGLQAALDRLDSLDAIEGAVFLNVSTTLFPVTRPTDCLVQSDPQLVAWTQRQDHARNREGSLCERTACFFPTS